MNGRHASLARGGVLAYVLLAATGGLAQDVAPKIQGTLKINGKELPLRHAFAVQDPPEMQFPGSPKGEFDLILMDNAVSDAELECRTLLIHRVRKGGLRGVILTVHPAKKQLSRGNLL